AQRPRATARARSRKTIGIARGVASFEANLMNPVIVALNKEIFVKRDAAVGIGVKFHHPTANVVGIKLLIPCRIKRIREIDSLSVSAHFHHLRSPRERLFWFLRMRRAFGDAADAHGAGLLRIKWIRNI